MQKMLDRQFWLALDVRYPAAVASLLLSALNIWSNPVVNTDAYTYIRAAEIFLQDGLAAAVSYYSWAFYPVLIALVHKLTGLELFAAAHVLNAGFFALLCTGFITLVKEIDASRRLAIIAALVILLYPQINEYRSSIIRDIAFITFSLFALLHLLRYLRQALRRHALGFISFTLLAALFRPEALLYLISVPFSLLLIGDLSWSERWRRLLSLQAITVGLLLAAVTLFWFYGVNPLAQLLQGFSGYALFLEQAVSTLRNGSPQLSDVLFSEHAGNYSAQYINLFLATGLSTILLVKIFTGFGWIMLAILAYGWWQRLCQVPRFLSAPALAYLLTAFLILLSFVFVTRYMTTRYTLLFCIVTTLLVPFILDRAWQRAELDKQLTRFRWIAATLLLYCFIDAYISFGESKDYQQEVARWLVANSEPDVVLLTNNHYLAYHTGLIDDYDRISRIVDPDDVPAAASGTRIAYTLERGVLEMMQGYEQQGLVTLEQYFPNADEPQMGIYRRR
ncbi:MAG: hypothetical protein RQ757_13445 [Pseudomonadales bacterium]|nr:hypothetical protein [Pseudomonadales bacterium]